MFKAGDKVRLVQILPKLSALPKWHDYVGREAVVVQRSEDLTKSSLTRIQFEDGEWFPAHYREIVKIKEEVK